MSASAGAAGDGAGSSAAPSMWGRGLAGTVAMAGVCACALGVAAVGLVFSVLVAGTALENLAGVVGEEGTREVVMVVATALGLYWLYSHCTRPGGASDDDDLRYPDACVMVEVWRGGEGVGGGRATRRGVGRGWNVRRRDWPFRGLTRADEVPGAPLERGIVGLRNMGNSCYLSASTQCLEQVPELAALFVSGSYESQLRRADAEITRALAAHFRKSWGGQVRVVTPWDLKRSFGPRFQHFAGYEQQDAQEFIGALLDHLHEDLNQRSGGGGGGNEADAPPAARMRRALAAEGAGASEGGAGGGGRGASAIVRQAMEAWREYDAKNASVVSDRFSSLFSSTLRCSECGFCSVRFEPFVTLPVPVPPTLWTLHVTVLPDVSSRVWAASTATAAAARVPSGGGRSGSKKKGKAAKKKAPPPPGSEAEQAVIVTVVVPERATLEDVLKQVRQSLGAGAADADLVPFRTAGGEFVSLLSPSTPLRDARDLRSVVVQQFRRLSESDVAVAPGTASGAAGAGAASAVAFVPLEHEELFLRRTPEPSATAAFEVVRRARGVPCLLRVTRHTTWGDLRVAAVEWARRCDTVRPPPSSASSVRDDSMVSPVRRTHRRRDVERLWRVFGATAAVDEASFVPLLADDEDDEADDEDDDDEGEERDDEAAESGEEGEEHEGRRRRQLRRDQEEKEAERREGEREGEGEGAAERDNFSGYMSSRLVLQASEGWTPRFPRVVVQWGDAAFRARLSRAGEAALEAAKKEARRELLDALREERTRQEHVDRAKEEARALEEEWNQLRTRLQLPPRAPQVRNQPSVDDQDLLRGLPAAAAASAELHEKEQLAAGARVAADRVALASSVAVAEVGAGAGAPAEAEAEAVSGVPPEPSAEQVHASALAGLPAELVHADLADAAFAPPFRILPLPERVVQATAHEMGLVAPRALATDAPPAAGAAGALAHAEDGSTTLTACLNVMAAAETLESAWECERCKARSRPQKQHLVFDASDVVVVLLKRFHQFADERGMYKNNRLVRFPVRGLDLRPYVHPARLAWRPADSWTFDLFGVVEHYGSLSRGHYTACVRSAVSGTWYSCDDDLVRPIADHRGDDIAAKRREGLPLTPAELAVDEQLTADAVQARLHSPAAYVLFYRRAGSADAARAALRDLVFPAAAAAAPPDADDAQEAVAAALARAASGVSASASAPALTPTSSAVESALSEDEEKKDEDGDAQPPRSPARKVPASPLASPVASGGSTSRRRRTARPKP